MSAHANVIDAFLEGSARVGRRRKPDQRPLSSALLMALFVTTLLLSLIASVDVYRTQQAISTATNDTRLSDGLVTSAVRAADASGSVAVGQGPEGRSLVLVQRLDSGTYETRIYLYQGNVVQEYALQGSAYTPAKATVLASSDTFSFAYSQGLLSVTTDSGTSDVALRSAQGGE
jgi:hypothetical protein